MRGLTTPATPHPNQAGVKMSFQAAAWAINQSPKTVIEKLILILLADCHNKDNGRCDPSLNYLTRSSICTRPTVIKAIKSLESQGYIKVEKRQNNRQQTNQYYLVLEPELVKLLNQPSKADIPELVKLTMEAGKGALPEPVNNQELNQEGTKARLFVVETLGVSAELWDEFLATRKRLKAPNSPLAITTLINRLIAIRDGGYSPNEAVENSNSAGWKTVYMPSESKPQQRSVKDEVTDTSW